jgi:hypothetical protein
MATPYFCVRECATGLVFRGECEHGHPCNIRSYMILTFWIANDFPIANCETTSFSQMTGGSMPPEARFGTSGQVAAAQGIEPLAPASACADGSLPSVGVNENGRRTGAARLKPSPIRAGHPVEVSGPRCRPRQTGTTTPRRRSASTRRRPHSRYVARQ